MLRGKVAQLLRDATRGVFNRTDNDDYAVAPPLFLARPLLFLAALSRGVPSRTPPLPRAVPMEEAVAALKDFPFEGQWDFTPLGDGQRACKVEFSLRYDFNSMALAAIVGPVFDRIAGSLVDAFVKRANQVYEPS